MPLFLFSLLCGLARSGADGGTVNNQSEFARLLVEAPFLSSLPLVLLVMHEEER